MAWTLGHKLQDGKYTIEQELGEGGFGITYRARDSCGRVVVIKTLNDNVQRRPDFAKFQQDFLNEALRLARCSHPHIVRIDEVIQEEPLWCIVMEYIDGENLASRVENQGALSEAEALRYIQQIGEALTVVHNNGLLHRDIKPHNIMLRFGKSEAVLIDFGIAREFSPNLTQTHTQLLSDGFAPIEQYEWRTKRGAYTDVYALAATLYSLLTGKVPTPAPLRAMGTLLESPKQVNPRISERVNWAILKGMEVKPDERPQSIQEWLDLLSVTPKIPSFRPTSPVVSINSPPHYHCQPEATSVPLISEVGADYRILQGLLARGQWRAADAETKRVMLWIAHREQEGYLNSTSINLFSCKDLCTINQLWLRYSMGRFGFSVQKQIWDSINGNWDRFGERVGWRVNKSWLKYSDFTFGINAPQGHLPDVLVLLGFVWQSNLFGGYWSGWSRLEILGVYSFVSQVTKCMDSE